MLSYSQRYYQQHKNYYKEYNKEYRKKKGTQIAEANKRFYENNKDYFKEYCRNNREKYIEAQKRYLSDPEKLQKYKEISAISRKKYYEANKEMVQEKGRNNSRNYYEQNKEIVREKNLTRYHEKEKIREICECGKEINTLTKHIHIKSKCHSLGLENKNKERVETLNNNIFSFKKWMIPVVMTL